MNLFGDEAGNPGDFADRPDDRYFMVVTVTLPQTGWLTDLAALGARLRSERTPRIGAPFHAAKDRPEVKREVYALLARQTLRVDATMVDKRRLGPALQERRRLYAAIWAAHLVSLLPQFHPLPEPIEVVVASIGTGRDLRAFRIGAERAVAAASAEAATYSAVLGMGMVGRMRLGTGPLMITSRAGTPELEPGLQVADYCTWAIRRRWERPAEPAWAYSLIQHLIGSERLVDLAAAP